MNNITGEFQAGFKQNYSTIDHIFTLMAFIQKQFSLNRKLYVAFIDYEKHLILLIGVYFGVPCRKMVQTVNCTKV